MAQEQRAFWLLRLDNGRKRRFHLRICPVQKDGKKKERDKKRRHMEVALKIGG